jgi:ribosomal protein L16 Arg81 hydroxylase
MAEQMVMHHGYIELGRIQQQYGPMMELAISEQVDLSEEDRQRLLTRLADWDSFAQRFYELFVERVDFTKIIQTVYQPLYDKYFTADELKEIVVFYRTPVGRKLMESMPALMQEAGQAVDQQVQPQAVALIQEIFADEVENLKN